MSVEKKKGIGAEFREFLLRGNVIDLAIAVVIGTAFGAVVTAFVRDMVTPVVSIFLKRTNFQNLVITARGARFAYGDFLNVLLAFVVIAAVLFFFVVKPVNYLMERRKRRIAAGLEPEEEASLSDEALLLREIRDLLKAPRVG